MTSPILLIGMRGAGKTSLGSAAALALQVSFFDADAVLEKKLGQSIFNFVASKGEAAFRVCEQETLGELLKQTQAQAAIIACGGGCIESEATRRILLSASCLRIWIDILPEIAFGRLRAEPERLQIGKVTDFAAFLALYQERRVHYEQLSKLRVSNNSDKETPALEQLIHLSRQHWAL